MARKAAGKGSFTTAKQGQQGFQNIPWQGFINVNLNEATKKKAAEYFQRPNFVGDGIDQLLQQGYRLTLKYDLNSGGFSAFVTPVDASHKDAGWGLSERAGSWFRAVERIIYIHFVVLDGEWDNAKQMDLPGLDDW